MNKLVYNLVLIIVTLCVSFMITSCEKKPFDARNKFIGDYNFSIKRSRWNINGLEEDTTYSYYGKIGYGEGNKGMSITFSSNYDNQAELYEDWFIISDDLFGEFTSKDALEFVLSYNGQGGGTRYDVTGEKAK